MLGRSGSKKNHATFHGNLKIAREKGANLPKEFILRNLWVDFQRDDTIISILRKFQVGLGGGGVSFYLGQMFAEELGHAKSPHFVLSKDLGHSFVWLEKLLVFRILQLVFLDVGPQLLDALASGGLSLADNVGQLVGQAVLLGEAGSFGHF